MKIWKSHRRSFVISLFAFVIASGGSEALLSNSLCTATHERWTVGAGVDVVGVPGSTVTVTWTLAGGGTAVVTGTIPNSGKASIAAPAGVTKGDAWTVVDSNGCTSSGTQLASLSPPDNTALATHQITVGQLALAGEVFELSGSFQIVADQFEGDLSSPDYGLIQGFLPMDALSIVGQSTTGPNNFELFLNGDLPFAVDLAPALALPYGQIAFSNYQFPVDGFIVLNGVDFIDFAGQLMGQSTYESGPDSPEVLEVTLQLNTPVGLATGSLESEGSVQVIENSSPFIRGDANRDGTVDIADAIAILGNLFPGAGGPNILTCADAADTNDDGGLNIADAITTLTNLFPGPGGPPGFPAPNPNCGTDPTDDPLDCASYPPCP